MIIGLLAYHATCNFGANLQLLSTYEYLKKVGVSPIIINWVPLDLEYYYIRKTSSVQYEVHKEFREKYFVMTTMCRTESDVASAIINNKIEAVIIGSDAVVQHHSLLERLRLSTRSILTTYKPTSDRMFPNPFWASFLGLLPKKIPCALLSASSQDSRYCLFSRKTIRNMRNCLEQFCYVSVRDEWTRNMISFISGNHINPKITPDPVFSFNDNAGHLIPSKDEIKNKHGLKDKYLLFSFLNDTTVSSEWCSNMKQLANNSGYQCVSLAFPYGILFNSCFEKQIDIPLSPIDWYALIKYSSGYIGHNMHPIVVCLHNAVPFYSFDNYGVVKLNGLLSNDKSSKIYHILSKSGFLDNRISCTTRNFSVPSPSHIFDKIRTFDCKKAATFAKFYQYEYISMMDDILKSINTYG